MGTWGTSLYSNDTTCDIRGDYIEKLRCGKSEEEAMEDLIQANRDIFGDWEEESLFWYALADTQWNNGRLHDVVKKKALEFISVEDQLDRFADSNN